MLIRENGWWKAISIHAPARGATITIAAFVLNESDFNSRPCERGDRGLFCSVRTTLISIHAPARGATVKSAVIEFHYIISIHAPARGATPEKYDLEVFIKFQFTPLREGRQKPDG